MERTASTSMLWVKTFLLRKKLKAENEGVILLKYIKISYD